MKSLIKLSNDLYIKGYEKHSLAALEIQESLDAGRSRQAQRKIISLADSLDSLNLEKEANFLDSLLSNLSVKDVGSFLTEGIYDIPFIGKYLENYIDSLKRKLIAYLEDKLGISPDGFLAILMQELFAGLTIPELIELVQDPNCELISSEITSAMQRATINYKFGDSAKESLKEFIGDFLGIEEGGFFEKLISAGLIDTSYRYLIKSITEDTTVTNFISKTSCAFIMGYIEENNFFAFLKDKSPKEVYDKLMGGEEDEKSFSLDTIKEKTKNSLKEKSKELLMNEIHQGIDDIFPDIPGFDYKYFLPDSLK